MIHFHVNVGSETPHALNTSSNAISICERYERHKNLLIPHERRRKTLHYLLKNKREFCLHSNLDIKKKKRRNYSRLGDVIESISRA